VHPARCAGLRWRCWRSGPFLAGPEITLATTDTAFGDPLDTVENIAAGTGMAGTVIV